MFLTYCVHLVGMKRRKNSVWVFQTSNTSLWTLNVCVSPVYFMLMWEQNVYFSCYTEYVKQITVTLTSRCQDIVK